MWLMNERLWLPEGVKWSDLESNGTARYPHYTDLRYTIKFGAVMLLVRILMECFVFLPLGSYFGWVVSPDPLLRRILTHLNFGFAGNSKFKRVAETAWRFSYYVFAWFFGLYVLKNEPQLRDITECWRNWPHHTLSAGVWWYYIIETSFYWSLLFSSLVFDIRRADFIQLILHHSVTILLLFMSYSMNMIRVGTLVLFSHDIADIFIEMGKLFRYARWNTALKVDYVVFMITWILTRLIYYPFWIIWSILFDAPSFIQASYRWENFSQNPIVPRILVAMLLCLLVLHIFWTYTIIMVAVKSAESGEIDDIRELDEDNIDYVTKKLTENGSIPEDNSKKTA
uniref:TLC domain-containing protein n=1 Tax=Syphacia muris TaxID=451379 RepID=A0A0N5AM97_9BILA